MIVRTNVSRRRFLSGLGGAGAALAAPFLRREAAAQTAAIGPVRLLVLQSPDGCPGVLWKPTGSGTSFSFGQTMQAFEPLKSDAVLIEGINHLAGGGEPHCQAFVQWMTGRNGITTDNYTAALSPSVDQLVASNAAFVGPTRFKSLQLGADMSSAGNEMSHRYISWAGANQPLPAEHRPLQNYSRIFAGIMPGGGTRNAETQTQAALARLVQNRRSVLDLVVKKDGARLMAALPAAQRDYFDAHLQSIRTLEERLATLSVPPPSAASCVSPNTSSFPSAQDDSANILPTFWKANTEILRLALVCDLSRVVTFLSSPTVSHLLHYKWIQGMTSQGMHHDFSHNENAPYPNQLAINRWYAERIAELVTGLKNTNDGAGSLLDNTLVIYGSEFGSNGFHSTKNIPFVLFGKAGGRLRTGRHLSYLSSPRSSNDLWLSALQLLQMPMATVGDPAKCQGPLPDLV